ncbi:MAG TPA: ABC transporter ATP-binding protein [Chloroflexia bacterium]|nr:ABC transporter ATP-binding protein [Chloroflexia bacterium]
MTTLEQKKPAPLTANLENSAKSAIKTEKLTKSYGRNRGIIELDLEVYQGEIFGYLGPNGAGKTTTIRLLMDLIKPTGGSASIYGLDCQQNSVEIKRFTGYLPGEFSLYPNLTGAQTLKYFANLRGGVEWKRIKELAERLQLDLSKKFKEYSHGNKQKVGIIQAVMHQPRLLIVDEPTNGLDPLNQQEFYKLLHELREQGSTIFMSSHIMSEIETTCDRVGLIREGRMVRVGSMDELVDLKRHHLEVVFENAVPVEFLQTLPGLDHLEITQKDGQQLVRCVVKQETLGEVVGLLTRYPIVDFVSREPSLETIFLDYYSLSAANNETVTG